MEITLRIALAPEAALLAAELLDVLRDVRSTLSRIGWNDLARREKNTGVGAAEISADPPEAAEAVLGDVPRHATAADAPRPGDANHPAGEAVAAAPRPRARSPNGEWTPDRDRDAEAMWRLGIGQVVIAEELSRLHGAKLSANHVKHRALGCGWKREIEAVRGAVGAALSRERLHTWRASREPAEDSRPRPPALPAPAANGRIYADHAAISAWAGFHDLHFDGDMLPVQRLTRRIGHPDIVCVEGPRA